MKALVLSLYTGVAALGLMLGGCGVSFNFGAPPIRYPSRQQVDRCVFENSLSLRGASSSYTDHARFGDLIIIRELKGRGYTFYQGTRRLTAAAALRLLGDVHLERAYRKIWAPFDSAGRRWVLGGWVTMGVGTGLVAIGGAVAAVAYNRHDLDQDKAAQKRAYAGLGVLGVGALAWIIAPILLRSGYMDKAVAESLQTIFISSSYQGNLQTAVRRYNERVAQRCRGGAPRTIRGREVPPE